MRVILSLFLLISILSCNSNAAPSNKDDVKGDTKPTETHYVIKIDTVFYRDGEISKADSVSNFIDLYMNEDLEPTMFDSLQAGIKVLKDTSISINLKDKSEDDKTSILWVGYTFDDEDNITSKSIELLVDKNITLSLIVRSDKDTVEIAKQRMFLTVDGNGSVKVGENTYTNGYYDIVFLLEQKVILEAILPTNKNVLFNGFTSSLGLNDTNMITSVIMDSDIVIGAKFLDVAAEKVAVVMATVPADKGSVYVNGEKLPATGLHIIPDLAVGTEIKLKAVPADERMFSSWNDDLKGFLSSEPEYKYVVSANASITPIFSALSGVVSVSINPRTNYFTGGNMHRENLVFYRVIRDNTIVQSTTNFGGDKKPLNWVNNTIEGLDSGDTIELTASQGEGFYNKAGPIAVEKVTWSGDVPEPGTGLTRTITAGAKSKVLNLNFEVEKRNITVVIDRENELSDNTWIKEYSTNNAKGFTIIINETNVVADMLSVTKTFDWHQKVKVEVVAGIHYSNYTIDNALNPEESYNTGIPKISTVTFDLEQNATNTAVVRHKKVDVTLEIVGGKFDSTIDAKYNAHVKINGTGDDAKNGTYESENWYTGSGTKPTPKTYTIPILSGIPITINANPTSAYLFRTHTVTGFISGNSTTQTNIVITNTGNAFKVTSEFYAPIWTLSVNMKGNIQNGDKLTVEPDGYKTADYVYEITPLGGDKSTGIVDKSRLFKVTNGLPTTITAIPDATKHYTLYSMSGVDSGVLTRDVISTDNSSVQIDFAHNKRKMKLGIVGGKDDRNTSHVEVSGTGFSEYNKTYYASNKNTLENGTIVAPLVYDLEVLSGIKNIKITAVTSSIHNFDKITKVAGNAEVTPVGTQQRGHDTYSKTNVSTIDLVPADDNLHVEVQFRINSYMGGLTGLKGDAVFNTANKKAPQTSTIDGIVTHNVHIASELVWLAESSKDFSGQAIRLMNDIYLGSDSSFNGFTTTFKGKFTGDKYIIFDPNIRGRGLFHKIEGASITSLVTGRGSIYSDSGDNVGLIGESVNSQLKFITNTSSINASGNNVGGIVGKTQWANNISYVGNYGKVSGNMHVGGVIGYMEGYGYKHDYWFNRGEVVGTERVGGVIGTMASAGTRAYKLYNTGTVKGGRGTAGLVGVMGWSRMGDMGDLNIQDFYNIGKVEGGSGVVGIVVGCREIISKARDNSMDTFALLRGYSIGEFDKTYGAPVITLAGHLADTGYHVVYNDSVYYYDKDDFTGRKKPLKDGLDHATWLDPRLDAFQGGMADHWVIFYKGSKAVKSSELTTSLEGLTDTSVWRQVSGLPAINGFTSRPVLVGFEETDLPSYMHSYN